MLMLLNLNRSKELFFLLEVEWGSRMTREGYDQCLGISHNLSPILP